MKIANLNPKKHYLDLEIEGKEKRYGLLNTWDKHIKQFYLGYYTEPMFINIETQEISDNIHSI